MGLQGHRYRGLRRVADVFRGLVAASVFVSTISPLAAQAGGPEGNEVLVGSELERYLRLLQSRGAVDPYPWSLRGLSLREVDLLLPRDSAHPWAERIPSAADSAGGLQVKLLRPEARLIFNSTFPHGSNDGAIWAGRGLTTAVQAGLSARYGSVSLLLAPIAFHAQNADFPLVPNGHAGRLAFADRALPHEIDLPQRFGDRAYTRIDPGQSTLRVDAYGAGVGVSTANQHWGPAREYPLLLGNNAAGFLHVFAGTSAPVDVWVGRLHGRVMWGRLDQSGFSTVPSDSSRRFATGYVGVFAPRGLDGLELGVARFYHFAWPDGALRWTHVMAPFESFFKEGLPDTGTGREESSDAENQLASVFARWVLAPSGVEVYGEYGREDHSWDSRDFLVEPDHSSAYVLGFHKVWKRPGSRFLALRGEVLNAQVGSVSQVRYQAPFYVHTWVRQGHTQRGQLLGAAAGYGGAGSLLAADYYHPGGRWTASWSRELRQDRSHFREPGTSGMEVVDVVHTLGTEALFFRGRLDLTAGVAGSYNLNRNFGGDMFNLNAIFRIRAGI